MITQKEEWRDALGFEGYYQVSSLGRLRRNQRPSVMLKQRVDKFGYANVCLSVRNKKYDRRVHVLVCVTFHGPRPDGLVAAHGDGVRLNNRADNLRWASPAENEADKKAHGTVAIGHRNGKYTKPHMTPRGSAHGAAKLCSDDVSVIREMLTQGIASKFIAAAFGVSRTSIYHISIGKTWREAA